MTINRYAEEELHSWNMQIGDPLSCSYCHNDTVKALNKVNRYRTTYNNVTTVFSNYSGVPVANFSRHLNGRNDIGFDRTATVMYKTSGGYTTLNLSAAGYNSANKSCTNVSCHMEQKAVKWGVPYRWYYYTECDRCHQFAYSCQ
jgi:predicted CxxxxCH...CXXCH cytochrome family protein